MILIFFLLRVYFVLSEFNLRVRKAPSALASDRAQRMVSRARAASRSVKRNAPNRGGVTSDGGIIGL